MGDFGESLRRERELRGVTLAELARATKISQRHLRALEDSDFPGLPGGVISRGFVRSVAKYLNLDEEFWLGEYSAATGDQPVMTVQGGPGAAAGTPAVGGRAMTVVLLLILFGVGAFGIHYVQKQQAEPPAIPGASAAGGSTAAAGPGSSPPASEATGTLAGTTANGQGIIEVAGSELRLQVDTLQDAWVQVTADDSIVHEGMLSGQQTRTITARREIEVVTRNASAVVLTLNGETLPPLGYPGETKSIVLRTRRAAEASLPQS